MKKLIIICFFSILPMFWLSCKKDSSGSGSNNNTPAPKALNKTTLTPNKWYSQGSSVIHDFQAGGGYGTQGGNWSWKGTTDTMQIVTQSGYPVTQWKFYWNNDTMMECEKVGTFTTLAYKKHAW